MVERRKGYSVWVLREGDRFFDVVFYFVVNVRRIERKVSSF